LIAHAVVGRRNSKASREGPALQSGEVAEFGLFRNIGRALEVEVVAVGIGYGGVPKAIAYERLAGGESTREEFAVEGDGVSALEKDGDPLSSLFFGNAGGEILLKHQVCVAEI
jgi:hypothetical protein